MTATTSSTMMTARCRGTWEEGTRTRLQVRGFAPFYSDEPKPLGGTDMGPNPVEYLLAALNGCIAVMIHVVAAELDFKYEGVEMVAEGALDTQGLMGVPGVCPYFQTVSQTVKIKTAETPERLEKLKEVVESRCPVATMFRDLNTPVEAHWEIV